MTTRSSVPSLPRRLLLGAAVAACLAPGLAAAQAYPTRPAKLLVTFTAGGVSDIIARLYADRMGASMGQQLVVDNRPGAGGNIAAEIVANSPPDGYTLLMGTLGTHGLNQQLYGSIPYDPVKSFEPVGMLATLPLLMAVNPALPVNNLADFVAYAKANPGKLFYATAGIGSAGHMTMELFRRAAGIDIVNVPYRGGQQAIPDLLSGQVQAMFDATTLPLVQGGKLKPMAVSGARRWGLLPDVPTVAESGYPGFLAVGWFAVFAPKGTPRPIVDRLSAEIRKAAADPELAKKVGDIGAEVWTGGPEDLAAFVGSELAKWGEVVRAAGVKAE